MKKTTKEILLTIGIILVILVMLYLTLGTCLGIHPIRSEKITDQDTIEWLERSSPENYSAAKTEVIKLIEEELEITPERVAIRIVQNSSGYDYSYLKVYYCYHDSWYGFSLNWLDSRISKDLDHEILEILRN